MSVHQQQHPPPRLVMKVVNGERVVERIGYYGEPEQQPHYEPEPAGYFPRPVYLPGPPQPRLQPQASRFQPPAHQQAFQPRAEPPRFQPRSQPQLQPQPMSTPGRGAKRPYVQTVSNIQRVCEVGKTFDEKTTAAVSTESPKMCAVLFSASNSATFFVESAQKGAEFLLHNMNISVVSPRSVETHAKERIANMNAMLDSEELEEPNVAGIAIVQDIFFAFSNGGARVLLINRDRSFEQLFEEDGDMREVEVRMRSTKTSSHLVIASAIVWKQLSNADVVDIVTTAKSAAQASEAIYKKSPEFASAAVLCVKF